MSKIAIDIVLLSPEEIVDLAIKLNRSLVGPETNKIVLGKSEGEAMPHMTLTMGCIEEGDLDKMQSVLDAVSGSLDLPDLEIYGVDVLKIRENIPVPCLGIKKIDEIQDLHEEVNLKMSGVFAEGATREMFYDPPAVSMEEFSYIDKFYEIAGGEKFYPHITLGLGEIENQSVKFPIKFRAAKIAICHLGDYYTCRKILWSKDLK